MAHWDAGDKCDSLLLEAIEQTVDCPLATGVAGSTCVVDQNAVHLISFHAAARFNGSIASGIAVSRKADLYCVVISKGCMTFDCCWRLKRRP